MLKLTHPTFQVEIPSKKQTINLRPMLTKEDKLLLFAKEDENPSTAILQAIKQVVNNCILTEGIDVDTLTIFDLEWLFIKLRIVSVSPVVKASYTDNEDEQVYDFEVNLENVKIKWPDPTPLNKVDVYAGIVLNLKFPEASLYSNKEFFDATNKTLLDVFVKNIISDITTPDSVSNLEGTSEEIQDFIDNLPIKTREGIISFLNNQPTIYYKIEYTNKKGTAREIEFRTLNDFFTFV